MKHAVAGQLLWLQAFNADGYVEDNQLQITCDLILDGAAPVALGNPTQATQKRGAYYYVLTVEQATAHALKAIARSATLGVQVLAAPPIFTTREADILAKANQITPSVVRVESSTLTNGRIPHIVRGDDYTMESRLFYVDIAAPADAGLVGNCSTIFAGYSDALKMGWRVTGIVEDRGAGIWRLKSGLASADTIPLKPATGYEWTHTLVDANGKIRTRVHGTTELIDGYAVARY